MSLFSLRSTDPELLARLLAYNRVHRGIRWLHAHAPEGWYLRFFAIRPQTWYCRAQNNHERECALAIAFETDSTYADQYGYVTYVSVLKRLKTGLMTGKRENGFARMHGFATDYVFSDMLREAFDFPPRESRIWVTSELLDEAWENLLVREHWNRVFSPKHYSQYDRAIDERFDEEFELSNPSLLRRLFKRYDDWFWERKKSRGFPTLQPLT